VSFENEGLIRWNGEVIDEAELARRDADHCTPRPPYAIFFGIPRCGQRDPALFVSTNGCLG
jgi:hypothetical protein